MNSITIEEVKELPKDSYQLIDIRDAESIAHGAIPGAIAAPVSYTHLRAHET